LQSVLYEDLSRKADDLHFTEGDALDLEPLNAGTPGQLLLLL